MLKTIHTKDNAIFEALVDELKTRSYQDFLSMPERMQPSPEGLSEHTTIEISRRFDPIDAALHIVVSQFLWLSEENDPTLIQGMHTIAVPLPNRNPALFYSGHCKTEFFYVLKDDFITDDVFERNERAEASVLEAADWFGTTGLTDTEERGIAAFMRYEYGDLLIDEDGLKAHDLEFMGCFHLNQTLTKKLKIEAKFPITELYVWHYYDDHYAYAYRDPEGVLHYDLGTRFNPEQFKRLPINPVNVHASLHNENAHPH